MANQRAYLETSFFRYLIAQPSTEPVKAERQRITRAWWNSHRDEFRLRVSQIVYDEFCMVERSKLSADETRQRHLLVQQVQQAELLPLKGAILEMAKLLIEPSVPRAAKAEADALHWAVAAAYGCEYVFHLEL